MIPQVIRHRMMRLGGMNCALMKDRSYLSTCDVSDGIEGCMMFPVLWSDVWYFSRDVESCCVRCFLRWNTDGMRRIAVEWSWGLGGDPRGHIVRRVNKGGMGRQRRR